MRWNHIPYRLKTTATPPSTKSTTASTVFTSASGASIDLEEAGEIVERHRRAVFALTIRLTFVV